MNISPMTIPAAPRRWHLFLLCYLLVAYIFSAITPPFQAPDEFDHVKRAYLLGEGHLMLESVNGSPSGGQIDQGLQDYMGKFIPLIFHANRKVSASELDAANKVQWSNVQSHFDTPTGTAYYFPALYLPSAAGLKLGKAFDLTVNQSYRLARLFTLCTSLIILFFAFRLYPPPIFALAVLALPMSLFQLSAAVLDGMSISVAVLGISAFMRAVADKERTSENVVRVLVISIALVAACRANSLPLLLLPFAAYLLVRKRSVLIWATASSLLVLGWTIWTIKFTVYPVSWRGVDHNIDNMGRLMSYVLHPWNFFGIVYVTLADHAKDLFYFDTFIGVLGWIDAPFSSRIYQLFGMLLVVTLFSSFSLRVIRTDWQWRSLIVLCTIASILMIFLALLVQWTIGSTTEVDGVQGRYFTISVLILAYALFGDARPLAGVGELLRTGLAALVLIASIHFTVPLLVNRYYTMAVQSEEANIVVAPSLRLSKDHSIQIHFIPEQIANPAALDAISLRMATYMASHPGKAVLRLWTNHNESITLPIDLSSVVDNAYLTFPLDGKAYIGGEIKSEGGEGISTYEAQVGNSSAIVECMLLLTHDKRDVLTPGCPQP